MNSAASSRARDERKRDTGVVIRAQERNAGAMGHSPIAEPQPFERGWSRDAQSRLALLRRKPEIVTQASRALAGKSVRRPSRSSRVRESVALLVTEISRFFYLRNRFSSRAYVANQVLEFNSDPLRVSKKS